MTQVLIEKSDETLAEKFQFSRNTLPRNANLPTGTFKIAYVFRVSRSILAKPLGAIIDSLKREAVKPIFILE